MGERGGSAGEADPHDGGPASPRGGASIRAVVEGGNVEDGHPAIVHARQRAGVGRTRVTAVGSCCRLRSIWFAKKGEWQGRST